MLPNCTVPDKIQAFIDQNQLFSHSDLVLVAVSGGPDSVALLHALHTLGFKLHVAHLNHGLRLESVQEAEYVQVLCDKLSITYTLELADTHFEKAENGGSIQEAARRVRYEFLSRIADQIGADVIATAHTKDDQVETVLLNIIRGTGIAGLSGIPVRRGQIVRPMLDISRTEVEEYCEANQLNPCHDASNDSTKYSRNEVRLKLIPYLQERFNSNVQNAILRLSDIARDENHALDQLASEWLSNHNPIRLKDLQSLAVGLQRRILQHWLENYCCVLDITFDHIERLRLGPATAWILPGNKQIVLSKGYLLYAMVDLNPENRIFEPVSVIVPYECDYAGWTISISGSVSENLSLIVRLAKHGDKIQIRNGHKKLSDAYTEEKVELSLRWDSPVLIDSKSGDVLAAANLRRISSKSPELKFTAKKVKEE